MLHRGAQGREGDIVRVVAFWRGRHVGQQWASEGCAGMGRVLKPADGGALCESTRQITAPVWQGRLPRRPVLGVNESRGAIWAIRGN